jgi:hypothetical protein
MPNSEADKQQIIRRLLVAKQEAHSLEISLRFKGRNDQADQLAAKATKLSDTIDTLLGQVMVDWVVETQKIVSDIGQANVSLQSSIKEIQNGIKVAQNVVKALGYVDDVVAIAAKIAATVA